MFPAAYNAVTSAAYMTSKGRFNEDKNWLIEIRRR